jgi:hypothetical protein
MKKIKFYILTLFCKDILIKINNLEQRVIYLENKFKDDLK